MSNYDKLINTLEDIFMLDKAELDFGIYRIMNQKRDEIKKFMKNDLVPQVKNILKQNLSTDKQALQKDLDEAVQQARNLGADPDMLPKVMELKKRMGEAADLSGLENEVFSLLTSFFKRYYDSGDFVSMRRYKANVYAIPYEGEEVKLHWANADQYYIKTSEYFRNYRFKLSDGKTVEFELIEAQTEQNNNKTQGEKERRFKLYQQEPVKVEDDVLKICFTYELMEKKTRQDDLLAEAFDTVRPLLPAGFMELLTPRPTEKDTKRTMLQKHLKDYTARNTFDYFIHKDLHGFLSRELDFYIKNEVLFIDDINTRDEQEFLKQLGKIKALKKIGEKIIVFLAQLENFQKKLWLKKKFVVETNYCITLDRVPEELYAEIAANEAQIDEWVKLFAIDDIKADLLNKAFSRPVTVEFLKQNAFLVLDTAFFSEDFKLKLVAAIENFDAQCDGLLINSENFQGLSLMKNRFNQKVDCIHIDPPYNTATSGFLYKNTFQHSSWLSMMNDRYGLALDLMQNSGAFMCHIDENEMERLHLLLENSNSVNLGTVVWDKGAPVTGANGLATQHEYILIRGKKHIQLKAPKLNLALMKGMARSIIANNGGANDKSISEWRRWLRSQSSLSKSEQIYDFIDEQGNIYRSADMTATEKRTDPKFYIPLVHPITNQPCPVPAFGWRYTPETLKVHIESGSIIFGSDHTKIPRRKVMLDENESSQMPSVYKSGYRGKPELDSLKVEFPFAHSTELYSYLLRGIVDNHDSTYLDFFAGSGTTGHAVINLNREDKGKRKFILVEMGDYFATVTKPRIQKVIYSKDWKDGKPVSREGISHCFKYLRLESYEDTLNNLVLSRNDSQTLALEQSASFKEGYMLGYMLDMESRDSLLNLEWFVDPFNCLLNITRNNETVETRVDLVETFNYLIGLTVEHTYPAKGYRVVTGTSPADEKILVVWRNVNQHNSEALNEFLRKSRYSPLDAEFTRIYVNGDNNVENLKTGDEMWKVVLIEEEFKKRMFEQG